MSTALDTSARYTVDEYPGVAFYVLGWERVRIEPEPFLVCEVEDCDHDDACYALDEEPDEFDSDVWVRAVMVGDDIVHHVEITHLHRIEDDAYCSGCGQIGCTADGRN